MSCRQGILAHDTPEKLESKEKVADSSALIVSNQVARLGLHIGKGVKTLLSSDPANWLGGVKSLMQDVQSKASVVLERLKNSSDWISDDDDDDLGDTIHASASAKGSSSPHLVTTQPSIESFSILEGTGLRSSQDSSLQPKGVVESVILQSENTSAVHDSSYSTKENDIVLQQVQAIEMEITALTKQKEVAVNNEDYQAASILKSKIAELKIKLDNLKSQDQILPSSESGPASYQTNKRYSPGIPASLQLEKPKQIEPYVKGGWLYSREPALLALWHKR
eukprot:261292-Hanusia_phi.AAC.1